MAKLSLDGLKWKLPAGNTPMELLPLLLACSLMFTVATPARDITDACTSQINDFQHLNSSGLHLTLHHPLSPCSPAPLQSDLPFSAVLSHDDARVALLASRLTGVATSSRPTSLRNKEATGLTDSLADTVPLAPGASLGVGNYVTRLGLGTPTTSYPMVVDTGSSLTWMQCQPCVLACHSQAGPIFNPAASSTYAAVPCSASQCGDLQAATLNAPACSVSGVCIYQASYGDSSFSIGYLSRDTVSFGSGRFPNFYFGCGEDNEGLFGQSAGLIGLARNQLSLFYQLAPSLGSSSFTYCLPTSASSGGYLTIGSYNPGQFSYTPMAPSSLDGSLYFVSLAGMSVAGSPLAVPASAYGSLPTIMDSGTVITRLPTSVYAALSSAVAAAMGGTPRAPAFSILDTCFQGQASQLRVPAVDMAFAGGAALKLPAQNVLIDVDGATTCLAFAPTDNTAIIGNTQQQTFSIVYDVAKSRIGFAPGGCS